MSHTYTIDGDNFTTLEGFYDEFGDAVLPGINWGKNLDAWGDVLSGGVGQWREGDTLVWKNSQHSRERLGYRETIRQLERQLSESDPSQYESILLAIELAKSGKGETVFNWLQEILTEHPEIHIRFE
jgi:RNAse (barnase) inhibitor barstar